jgi:hypothetical protein
MLNLLTESDVAKQLHVSLAVETGKTWPDVSESGRSGPVPARRSGIVVDHTAHRQQPARERRNTG